jgi:hypothetical protein
MTTENLQDLTKEELIESYKKLSLKFTEVANDHLHLIHHINCSMGTLKMFLETTKLNKPFPYKVVENELLLESYAKI